MENEERAMSDVTTDTTSFTFSLSCTPAGGVIQLLHEESHRTIARATGGGH
jgi:hypothetical protein